MSLAKITIEQNDPKTWHVEVEVGGMIAQRRVANLSTANEALLFVKFAYEDMMPQRAPAIVAAEPPAPPQSPPEHTVTTMIDGKPVAVDPVRDEALPAHEQRASLPREHGIVPPPPEPPAQQRQPEPHRPPQHQHNRPRDRR